MWLGRKQAEALRTLAAISQLIQKDSQNELKFQASRDPANFASKTALLLLSDDLKLCPSLSSLLTEHEAKSSRRQGNSRQCLAHLVQMGDTVLRIELHFCMDRQEGLKDTARKKNQQTQPCTSHSLCKDVVSCVLQKSSLTWFGLPPLGLGRWEHGQTH